MNFENKKYDDLNTKNTLFEQNNINYGDEYHHLTDKTEHLKKNVDISIQLKTKNDFDDSKKNKNDYNTHLKYGNYKILTYDKNGDPYLVLGPDYRYFYGLLIFNILFLLFIFYIFICFCSFKIKLIGFTLCFIQIFCFVFCALKNPGLPKKIYQNNKKSERYQRCEACKFIIDFDKNFMHCHICGCCCEGLDHHCVWTTKCIGVGNRIYFYLMLVFACLVIIYLVFATLLSVKPANNKCKRGLFK